MTSDGRLLRLYPVPFRRLNDQSQFKKWQWIEVDIEKARVEHGVTLGLVPAGNVLALEITRTRQAEWTEEERQKLIQQHMQGDLFADPEAAARRRLAICIPQEVRNRPA